MLCHSDTGKCNLRPKCYGACSLRIQHVTNVLSTLDDGARPVLARIGQQIGYGNAQHILGQLWDEEHDCAPRGSMGVTANERAAYKRGWDDCMKTWADHMKRMASACKSRAPTDTEAAR